MMEDALVLMGVAVVVVEAMANDSRGSSSEVIRGASRESGFSDSGRCGGKERPWDEG